jgi:hypothetical protein
MNCNSKIISLGVLLTALGAPMARAATVTFGPLHTAVTPGTTFDAQIVGQGFAELSGGLIDLSYDDNVVAITDVVIDPYWDFEADPGQESGSGRWEGIGFDVFWNDPASGNFVIATVSFVAAQALGVSPISILASSEFYGVTEALSPTIVDGGVTVIPLPAAVWLLLSGLGVLWSTTATRRIQRLAA